MRCVGYSCTLRNKRLEARKVLLHVLASFPWILGSCLVDYVAKIAVVNNEF